MNAELKRKWTEALRSGEFRQGRYQLQSDDAYCCLGVLCVVAGVPIHDGNSTVPEQCSYQGIYDLGVDEMKCSTLWALNDNDRPFTEIADYIDVNL